VADLTRYAALVSFAESADFGPHHVLGPGTKRVKHVCRTKRYMRWPCTSTRWSRSPIPKGSISVAAGQKIFQPEGCVNCHTPPRYTSNKLTLAAGYIPPNDAPATVGILRLSVGIDLGLALKTRKGTGYYKLPSLKGVWYQGHFRPTAPSAAWKRCFTQPDCKRRMYPADASRHA